MNQFTINSLKVTSLGLDRSLEVTFEVFVSSSNAFLRN